MEAGGEEHGQDGGVEAAADIIEAPGLMDAADEEDAAAAIAAAAVDWDDRLSWEDSERFEEDSLCSWLSEPESLIQNWRGWSSTNGGAENGTTAGVAGASSGHHGPNNHGGGSVGMAAAGASSSQRHHNNHSSGSRGGGCASPSHAAGASSALNYNSGLLSVGVGGCRSAACQGYSGNESKIFSLVELTAREVARNVPFELVERFYPPVPETLQLRVAFWSFPENEEDIRLYSCLANGNVDEFQKGEHLYRNRAVKDLLQIGFHLSGLVYQSSTTGTNGLLSNALSKRETSNGNGGGRYGHQNNWSNSSGAGRSGNDANAAISSTSPQCFNVAVTLDRRRITSCTCTCRPSMAAAWCAHVVAVCLHRIHQPETVCLRAPVSESLSRLQRDQLQKFAQYLISELPRQILPTAQRLLDDLLSQSAPINTVCGAPDPTAGASLNETSWWCLDDGVLHENIRKILVKFCQPSPTVFSDVNYLSSSAPPAASEWQSLMRPLRGREPEGLWNLLSIVREMYKRHDSNAAKLLRIITTECLNCDQVVLWWYHTKLSQSLNGPQLLPGCALVSTASSSTGTGGGKSSNNGNSGGALGGQTHSAQYSCASLLDDIVSLWRLLVLNPSLSPEDRQNFAHELRFYHTKVVEKVYRILGGGAGTIINAGAGRHNGGHNQQQQHGGGGQNHHHHNHHHHHHHHGNQAAHHHHHSSALNIPGGGKLTWETARFDSQTFPGFLPALEASSIDWADYPIDGVTYEPPRGRSPSYGSACGYLVLKEFGNGHTQQCLVSPASASSSSECGIVVSGVPVLRDKQYRNFSNLKPKETSSIKEQAADDGEVTAVKSVKPKSDTTMPKYDEIERLYLPEAQADEDNAAAERVGRNRAHSWSLQQQKRKSPTEWAEEAFHSLGTERDELEISSARCESLYAHGYRNEALSLASELAKRMMQSPPDLMVEIPVVAGLVGSNGSAIATNSAAFRAAAVTGGGISTMAGSSSSKSGPGAAARKKKRTSSVSQASSMSTRISSTQVEVVFIHPRAMAVSQLASATLGRAIFLFSVLADDAEFRPLAFQIGLWALELPRQPAATKFLEVKMHHQESEIVGMLKQLPLAAEEMEMLRQRAHRLRSGVYHHHHPSAIGSAGAGAVSSSVATSSSHKLTPIVLPLSLASFIFEALSWPSTTPASTLAAAVAQSVAPSQSQQQKANAYRAPGDEPLAFEAAVSALAMKSHVSEAEHPLLCEGIRRQKGDLALALLLRYRDHQDKLAAIMDRLLDHEMHQMYKHHSSNAIYYGHYLRNSGTATGGQSSSASTLINTAPGSLSQQSQSVNVGGGGICQPSPAYKQQLIGSGSINKSESGHATLQQRLVFGAAEAAVQHPITPTAFLQRSLSGVASRSSSAAFLDEVDSDSVQNNTGEISQLSEALDDMAFLAAEDEEDYDMDEDNVSAREDDGSPFWVGAIPRDNGGELLADGDAEASNAKSVMKALRQGGSVSDEAASAVSSSTAGSSDDSSSSGISTSGCGLRFPNVGQLAAQVQRRGSANEVGNAQEAAIDQNADAGVTIAAVATNESNGAVASGNSAQMNAPSARSVDPLNKACYMKLNRHRRYVTPSIPNQPSEAHAHFMMELAKRLLIEAGGSHSTAIFTSQGNGPQANQAHGGAGPHRQLHLCAFQIGLYSLGIHNRVTPNWLSRTYSSHVSWISGNAMEIGRTAIRILIDTWENHLTPTEAVTLADKASQSRDPGMIQAAAELALSTLPQAHALNPTEIFRALAQCKEQPTAAMLEKACLAVEQAAKDYGVYPEVLFRVAQTWYQMYSDTTATSSTASNATSAMDQQQQQQQQALIGHFGEPPPPMLHQHHLPQHQLVDAPSHQQFGGHHQHLHHGFGSNPRHPLNNGPPQVRPQLHPPQLGHPPAVSVCPPPPALLHQQQQQMAAAAASYGLHQHFAPPGPSSLPFIPAPIVRPPTSAAGTNGPPAIAAILHQNPGPPFQPHAPPLSALHHPPPLPQQAPISQGQSGPMPPIPPGGQPFFQQAAAAALMNAYRPFAAHIAAAAASKNFNAPILHYQPYPQQRSGQQQHFPAAHHHHHPNQYHMGHLPPPAQHQQQQNAPIPEKHVDQAGGQSRLLYASYRVGMLALETLGRRINDDRAFTKYSQNPTYGDDVKWLLKISKRLGLMYVQQFSLVAAQSVPSPFVLWDLASEVAMLFSRNTNGGGGTAMIPAGIPTTSMAHTSMPPGLSMDGGHMPSALSAMGPPPHQMAGMPMTPHPPAALYKALLHPHVQPLVQRCLQMFYLAAQQKLSHPRFMPADTEEVCALAKAARTAFLHTPGGNVHFNEFLQSLRRQKSCKKDVWNKILNHLNG